MSTTKQQTLELAEEVKQKAAENVASAVVSGRAGNKVGSMLQMYLGPLRHFTRDDFAPSVVFYGYRRTEERKKKNGVSCVVGGTIARFIIASELRAGCVTAAACTH